MLSESQGVQEIEASVSRLPRQKPSLCLEVQEVEDKCFHARQQLKIAAEKIGEWAGIPLPLEGDNIIVEKSYCFAKVFNKSEASAPNDYTIRNSFWSSRYRSTVIIGEKDGKIIWGLNPWVRHFSQDMLTLGANAVWGIEQELNALRLLQTLVQPHTFKMYFMTGMFLESSKRSNVRYLFRRLKPTIAMADEKEDVRILAALCMHPIAYYEGSWAGAMVTTDDVIAHLMMMRADEHMFWKRCNQHPPYKPEAGL
jgi:hypothetical protein